MGKYRQLKDDEMYVVDLDDPQFNIGCCDCGLVHSMRVYLVEQDGKIFLHFAINRLNRPTGQLRRHGDVGLIRGDDPVWYMERFKPIEEKKDCDTTKTYRELVTEEGEEDG